MFVLKLYGEGKRAAIFKMNIQQDSVVSFLYCLYSNVLSRFNIKSEASAFGKWDSGRPAGLFLYDQKLGNCTKGGDTIGTK